MNLSQAGPNWDKLIHFFAIVLYGNNLKANSLITNWKSAEIVVAKSVLQQKILKIFFK
jgi:hypothetical protein